MNIDESNEDSTTTETEPPETDTTYFSSTPYDSLREFENITRLWGRPRTTPSGQGLSQGLFPGFTREYTYFFNMPLNTTRTTSEEGLTLEEIRRETIDTVYDASSSTVSQCPISFDEFEPGECVLQIRRCGHIFKPEELRRWLILHTGCPVCRCDLQSTAPQDEDETDYSDLPDLIPPDEA
jgi:hypothetical protein